MECCGTVVIFCFNGTGTIINFRNRNRNKMESEFSQTRYKILYLIYFIVTSF
jgi:hypothetical protein